MKLLIHDGRVAATAIDEFQTDDPETVVIVAPDDFDTARMSDYVYRDGELVLPIAEIVRAERNARLTACDWTQLPDAPADTAAWAAYRQALRDVTAQVGFPWDVTWPTPPSG